MIRKKSLHRMLVMRIALVAIAISVAVGAVVAQREHDRISRTAQERALIATRVLALFIQDQLDAPGLGDHAEIQRALGKITGKGGGLGTGRYVLARVLDLNRREIARIEDQNYGELVSLIRYAGSGQVLPDGAKDAEFTAELIDGRKYVHALIPLASSSGKTVATVEGFFAMTAEQMSATRRNILNSVAMAVGIVLAATLLLYPVIVQLMRRLEGLSLNLLDANLEMIGVVGSTIAKRDSDTDAHNFRVTIYSVRVAEACGLDERMIRTLIKGAFLHDVGKIGIRDNILLKPGKLDEEEFREMKMHVNHGLDIVFRSSWLREAYQVVGSHHEKYEGNGYPEGLKGEEIPVLARIFAIADVFDALTSHRPYKKPISYDETIDILMKGRGSHFDPVILDLFVKISRPLFDIYGTEDDDRVRRDMKVIVDQYYKADVATFFA
jgi:HD-GYP domain-containing protein (c-di-GMP phosphodiesterase class II)